MSSERYKEVLIIAGGLGISTDAENTIQNKVSKSLILEALELDKKDFSNKVQSIDKVIEKLQDDSDKEYSVWGYSKNDNTLKNEVLQEGALVFITYYQAAIYVGEIFEVFESPRLNLIWNGRGWDHKIILKNVYQIFIPDPQNIHKKSLEKITIQNRFSPSIDSMQNILKLYENDSLGFRHVIGDHKNRGNFQGSIFAKSSKKDVLDRLSQYFILSHFEALIKEL